MVGKSYTNDIFEMLQKHAAILRDKQQMEEKLRAEQAARLEAEKAAEEPLKLIEKL
ncbi:hypothetical protein LINPERHAP2_LOCUS32223, partial [Linum perenne]